MSEDRFGDLGGPRTPGEGTRAGDKLAELDRREPEAEPARPPRPRGRYTWVVGVAALIAIIAAGINTLGNVGGGTNGPRPGTVLRPFAAAAVPGPIDKPVNLNRDAKDPAPGSTPACAVPPGGAVLMCPPYARPQVITFIVPVSSCEGYVDRLERLRPQFPQVRFVTVVSSVRQKGAAQLVRQHRWRSEVALDPDGELLTAYRVSLCATSLFVRRGGIVRASKVEAQNWSDAQVRSAIAATAATK